jgi:hypothetical protein
MFPWKTRISRNYSPSWTKTMEIFLDKNNGNLSAAIRDAIELADSALSACLKIKYSL